MVDPRRNGSIPQRKGSDQQTVSWLPINPGTDGALAAALLHELAFTHNALDWDFLHERCIGFTDGTLPERWRGLGLSVMDYLRGTGYDRVAKTPAWAAAITGTPRGRHPRTGFTACYRTARVHHAGLGPAASQQR